MVDLGNVFVWHLQREFVSGSAVLLKDLEMIVVQLYEAMNELLILELQMTGMMSIFEEDELYKNPHRGRIRIWQRPRLLLGRLCYQMRNILGDLLPSLIEFLVVEAAAVFLQRRPWRSLQVLEFIFGRPCKLGLFGKGVNTWVSSTPAATFLFRRYLNSNRPYLFEYKQVNENSLK